MILPYSDFYDIYCAFRDAYQTCENGIESLQLPQKDWDEIYEEAFKTLKCLSSSFKPQGDTTERDNCISRAEKHLANGTITFYKYAMGSIFLDLKNIIENPMCESCLVGIKHENFRTQVDQFKSMGRSAHDQAAWGTDGPLDKVLAFKRTIELGRTLQGKIDRSEFARLLNTQQSLLQPVDKLVL